MRKFLILAIPAISLLFLTAGRVEAQRRGGGFSVNTPGFSFSYGRPYYGGYYGGYYGNRSYAPYWYGIYPYGSYYYPRTYSYPDTVYVYPETQVAPEQRQSYYSGPVAREDQALIRVLLPTADARVWFEGSLMQQQGIERVFTSPALDPGVTFTYQVRASWMDNGREVVRERAVDIRRGQEFVVDFRRQEPEPLKALPKKTALTEETSHIDFYP